MTLPKPVSPPRPKSKISRAKRRGPGVSSPGFVFFGFFKGIPNVFVQVCRRPAGFFGFFGCSLAASAVCPKSPKVHTSHAFQPLLQKRGDVIADSCPKGKMCAPPTRFGHFCKKRATSTQIGSPLSSNLRDYHTVWPLFQKLVDVNADSTPPQPQKVGLPGGG